jgi:hypothetical protein
LVRLAANVLLLLKEATIQARQRDDADVLPALLRLAAALSGDEDGAADCGAVGLHVVPAAVLRCKAGAAVGDSPECYDAAAEVASKAASAGIGFPTLASSYAFTEGEDVLRRPLEMVLQCCGVVEGDDVGDEEGGALPTPTPTPTHTTIPNLPNQPEKLPRLLIRQLRHLSSNGMVDTGYVIWPSAVLLANWISTAAGAKAIGGKRCIELGCGCVRCSGVSSVCGRGECSAIASAELKFITRALQ